MAITARPEVLPPAPAWRARLNGSAFDDRHLDLLSHLLDDFIRIPGTPIRFGLDGIVGFIPGIGDILGGLASSILIVAAWMRGVPRVVVARMVLNVAIETAVGSLPVVGNLFDIGWRANRRNYALMSQSLAAPARSRAADWIFLLGVCAVLAALMLAPIFLFGWLLVHAKGLLAR